jgi:phosphoenolpyruvate carboxylase
MSLRKPKIERFNENVLSKYQIYNSIFITLPFDTVTNTGVFLPLFSELCQKGYQLKKNPSEIVDRFFEKYQDQPSEREKQDLLFRFIQYIERQVVLFDAIEDAAFPIVNNMDGRGTLRSIKEEAEAKNKSEELKEYLKTFKIRPVLTAHPTQFYPGPVLGIITDLALAIENNDLILIKKLLAQLGKTPFFKKEKPTPYDEAVSLIWYLENVFYHTVSKIYTYIQNNIFKTEDLNNQIINLGFWPGGDRDGNPFVTSEITLKVAERLRLTILKNYYRDLRKLKRRITFVKVDKLIAKLEAAIYDSVFASKGTRITPEKFLEDLLEIKRLIITDHQSLFIEEINDLINKVRIFGFHFASLDIRQDSRVHHRVLTTIVKETRELGFDTFPDNYEALAEEDQISVLGKLRGKLKPESFKDEMVRQTLESIYAMQKIQKQNGELGCNRYIISNNQTMLNIMESFAMIRLCNWKEPSVDIIPLFETVNDLQGSHEVMEKLYTNEIYAPHLKKRGNRQTIMLGFSDGTKDGGYLMANWSIFKAKEKLTEVSRKYGIKVMFFDGRGGPPARGGGKTHQFYASLGSTIADEEVQLTIQGQTISSNFGTLESSQYNLEQLLSSGISNKVFKNDKYTTLSEEDRATMQKLADISYQAYTDFKNHPMFLPYLERMSTLKYYAKTNIGSRPSKRGKSDKLVFSDLRAIPFVGSWSQLKQNVPGFFGVGYAISKFEQQGNLQDVKSLYQNSAFFKTLLENSMMSLSKSFFELTAYMKNDKEFGAFWELVFDEFLRSKEMILKVTGYKELMADSPEMRASIAVRESIVLPLLTIQQYALRKIQELNKQESPDMKELEVYEKIVTRSLFGNINASRNSA